MTLDELDAIVRTSVARAIALLDPADAVAAALPPRPPKQARVAVLAIGKAAAAMARGAQRAWGDRIERTLVITDEAPVGPIEGTLVLAAHPIPDERSEHAAAMALDLARSLAPTDLLVALISGGASALIASPPAGVSLAEKADLVRRLLASGASIRDVNLVRRHLSRVKGGRVAQAAGLARVLSLVISDVIDGALHDVGSGPTVSDPTTLHDARVAFHRFVPNHPLVAAMTESAKPHDIARRRGEILLDPARLGLAVAAQLRAHGLSAVALPADEGSAQEISQRRAAQATTLAPGDALVIPCEPTLILPSSIGRGGRAGWTALATIRALPKDVVLLCAASDGVDGSSGAAGACVRLELASAGTPIDEALATYNDAPLLNALGAMYALPRGHNLTDVHVLARAR
jgi:hydroxypyruvate reductase